MKLVTIGRESDNEIVINDKSISRHHLQIREEDGNFWATDLNSTNGTFVNGKKISGKTELSTSDSIQIGNSDLNWQGIFNIKKPKRINILFSYLSKKRIAAATVFVGVLLAVFMFFPNNENEIDMVEKGGNLYIPVKINGQELEFMFDTGASSVCISTLEAGILVKNGVLSEEDIIGREEYRVASGAVHTGMKINLKSVEICGKMLKNVEATIIDNPQATCLLGQTVLLRFGTYKIDNKNHKIIFD